MAITILTGTPGTPGTDSGGTASVSYSIPSTVPDGSLIIAIHDNDFRDITNMVAPVLTGFAPTMNLLGVADGGVNLSHIKVWAFDYPTGASGTLRTLVCTETGSHDGDKGLSVYALSGAAVAASALDGSLVATMSPSTSVASLVLGGVTTGNAGSVLFAHVRTSNSASTASITAPGSMTQRYDVNNFTRFTGATEQLAAAGATGTRTFTPASSVPYVAVMFAIQPAAGGSTVNGTATLTGAGAVSTAVTQRATAAPTGTGAVSALVTQRATAAPTGAGALAAVVTQQAAVAPVGAGTVSALVTQQAATAAPTGTGALAAAVTQRATAVPTGAGAVSAAVTQQATAAATGVGSLTAGTSSTVNGTATLTGTGALAAAVTQQAPAALAGTGALTANSTVSGTAALTGVGAVSTAVTQRAIAALAGAGSLTAAGPAGTQGFWGVHL